ncbi:putative serine incorporator/TMS membrane protein [Helianthus anomalus]
MYFAMLLIGVNSHHAMKKWTIDVGWTSTWVRIVNEWLAVDVYCKYLIHMKYDFWVVRLRVSGLECSTQTRHILLYGSKISTLTRTHVNAGQPNPNLFNPYF